LNDNQLVSLDSKLFSANRKISLINFSNNQLGFVGKNILTPLVNLDKAYFSSAGCISHEVNYATDIDNLKSLLNQSCSRTKVEQQIPCCDDVKALNERILDLEKENEEKQLKIEELETKNLVLGRPLRTTRKTVTLSPLLTTCLNEKDDLGQENDELKVENTRLISEIEVCARPSRPTRTTRPTVSPALTICNNKKHECEGNLDERNERITELEGELSACRQKAKPKCVCSTCPVCPNPTANVYPSKKFQKKYFF
jgi:chromosome segregation ATPase